MLHNDDQTYIKIRKLLNLIVIYKKKIGKKKSKMRKDNYFVTLLLKTARRV